MKKKNKIEKTKVYVGYKEIRKTTNKVKVVLVMEVGRGAWFTS